jgi:hypothetical protein
MPLTARESAKAPTGALAQASATAPKTPREARRITSNADIGTSRCVPKLGAQKAQELFTTLLNQSMKVSMWRRLEEAHEDSRFHDHRHGSYADRQGA